MVDCFIGLCVLSLNRVRNEEHDRMLAISNADGWKSPLMPLDMMLPQISVQCFITMGWVTPAQARGRVVLV